MKRYKVQYKSKDGKKSFMAICDECELEKYKNLCKKSANGNTCFYREYPLTKAKKHYF